MSYSKTLALLYDNLMEGYEYIINPTQKLVYEFTQNKKNIALLELGCGTGTILNSFPKNFSLYGLDFSPHMLAIAKKKVKRATFFEANMTNFSISKRFDVIICVFDTMNHLLEFNKWEKTFQNAAKHLKKRGVFVFDINTIKRHRELSKLPAYIKKEKNRMTVIKILQEKSHIFSDRLQIFKMHKEEKVTLFEENVSEASFSTQKVIKTLKKYFIIEKMLDAHREAVTKDTGRIFFACSKKITKTITA